MEVKRFVITERMKKQIGKFIEDEAKLVEKISIKICNHIKKEKPKLSLRELGKKFGKSKDTIGKWLKMGEHIEKEFEKYPESYMNPIGEKSMMLMKFWEMSSENPNYNYMKRYESQMKFTAAIRGIKRHDFEEWNKIMMDKIKKELIEVDKRKKKLDVFDTMNEKIDYIDEDEDIDEGWKPEWEELEAP